MPAGANKTLNGIKEGIRGLSQGVRYNSPSNLHGHRFGIKVPLPDVAKAYVLCNFTSGGGLDNITRRLSDELRNSLDTPPLKNGLAPLVYIVVSYNSGTDITAIPAKACLAYLDGTRQTNQALEYPYSFLNAFRVVQQGFAKNICEQIKTNKTKFGSDMGVFIMFSMFKDKEWLVETQTIPICEDLREYHARMRKAKATSMRKATATTQTQ